MSAKDFNFQLNQFIKSDVPEEIGKFARLICFQSLRGFVLKTPVDTGLARANWKVTVGRRSFTSGDATDKTGMDAIAMGNSTITSAFKASPYNLIYVQNNLPYIERLESGYSKQAPAGMFVNTIAEIEAQFT